ncbi:MAG: ABC transporter permease, partial [Rhodobacteraceae bacterium]|nr:ABC transporter permease [Paracoccaceae bacterium]
MSDTTTGGGRDSALLRFLWKAAKLLATVALTFLGLLLVTFLIGRVVPVDPVLAVIGDRAPKSVYDRVFVELGLDKPLYEQFWMYLQKVFTGDFGESFLTKRDIADDIARVFPATLELATVAILIGTLFGVPMGVWAAVRQGRLADQLVRVFGLVGYSAPIFWLGLLALLVFYARLHWVAGPGRIDIAYEYAITPKTGLLLLDSAMQGEWDAFRNVFSHIILPASLLGYFSMAYISRMTR